jgi:glycosyltransferase involved in cell wall biosynthesis
MRVLAFTKTDAIGPSSRYRYYAHRPGLARLGIALEIAPLFGAAYFRATELRSRPLRILAKAACTLLAFFVRGARVAALLLAGPRTRPDLVVIEHQLFPYLPALFERALAARGIPFTVEFDDAIYLTPCHRRKLALLCRLARRTVVGTPFLAGFVRAAGGRPEIVPTTIDLARYPRVAESPRRDGDPVIGWIGLPYNFPLLATLAEPLSRLATRQRFRLRVISAGVPELPGFPAERLEVVRWSEDGEARELAALDVGIMPLRDDEWSRGKCGLKILQYFAAGVAVVASPAGVNSEIVRHGTNGLLAASPFDWYESLLALLADPSLRATLAAAGRRTVELDYSLDAWTPKLASAWQLAATSRD